MVDTHLEGITIRGEKYFLEPRLQTEYNTIYKVHIITGIMFRLTSQIFVVADQLTSSRLLD